MSKRIEQTKKIQLKAKVRITSLVMGIVLLIFIIITILVPVWTFNLIRRESNDFLKITIGSQIRADKSGSSSGNDLGFDNERSFVIYYSSNTQTFTWKRGENTQNITFFSSYIENRTFTGNEYFDKMGDYYYLAMREDFADKLTPSESSLSSFKEANSGTADFSYYLAAVDKSAEISNTKNSSCYLIYTILSIYVLLIPLVYWLSSYVIQPTIKGIKDQNDFIANASHELKTPLAIITADQTLLREKYGDNVYLDNISSQCQNMNETILDMIELSKLETTMRPLEKVNVSDLLDDLAMSFDALAFESGIDYKSSIQKGLTLEKADKKDLTRIFNLLIDNALKYASGPKIIRLSLSKVKKGILFTSYNTGCEVMDEDREKVFNRFYQGKSGSEKERKGSGLGLAIVKEISEKYDYEVKVQSSYQKDITFTVLMK